MGKRYLTTIMLYGIVIYSYGQAYSIEQLNSLEFNRLAKDRVGTLLDVRTLNEYKNGHIKNAGQLNYYALDFKRNLLLLPKDKPIYLYCNTGYRSGIAAEILIENGYKNVYNLEHGILEWNLKGLPIIIEPDAKPDVVNKMGYGEFNSLINSKQFVFIDFYAPWCGPCKEMMPIIDDLKTSYKDEVSIVKINVDASKSLVKRLGIIGVPYFAMYQDGNMLFSKSGIMSRAQLDKLFKEKNQLH